jgi:AcrR family transcriptional regulator
VGEPEVTDVREPARRGRPLAAGRTDAILQAAAELFGEVGYDQLTVQDIAGRAGVGLATLYRRWPTKQALLAEALRHRNDALDIELTGTPVEQLETVFGLVAESTMGPQGEFLPGLLTAIRADDDLAEALQVGVIEPLRLVIREQLECLLGPAHPQLDLLVDLVPGICVFRSLAPGETGDPDELVASVMDLIGGLASSSPVDRAPDASVASVPGT